MYNCTATYGYMTSLCDVSSRDHNRCVRVVRIQQYNSLRCVTLNETKKAKHSPILRFIFVTAL